MIAIADSIPLDPRLQTRMQVLSASPAAAYASMSDAFTRISTTEGTRRLWRGVASVILGAGPAHAVYFGTYELAKELAGGNEGGYSFLATAGAGALATVTSDALMNPFDGTNRFATFPSVRTRLISTSHSREAADAGSRIRVPDRRRNFPQRVPRRRPGRLLRLVSDYPYYDCPVHGRPVLDI